ncbi:histone deacetylase [Paracoccaceae bacterium GXU_MW_L88]
MSLPIVWHPDYVAPLRPGHRFPMSKYGYLRDVLARRGLLPEAGGYIAPAPAPLRQIAAVHEIGYAERVFGARLTRAEEKRIGLPGSDTIARRARLSASGTLLAGRLALEHGLAGSGAGGSHHAGPEGGAGFCVFNDVAVAAQALLDEGIVRNIVVVDLDVHQGDGTARIFAKEPRVFTFSLHAAKNYPMEKAQSDLDVALQDGTEDAFYLKVLEQNLEALPQADLAFFNAGVDPYQGDRLGRLSLTEEGLRARDRAVFRWARSRHLPLAFALGGGYDRDPWALAARHANTFEEAATWL